MRDDYDVRISGTIRHCQNDGMKQYDSYICLNWPSVMCWLAIDDIAQPSSHIVLFIASYVG